MLKKWMAALLLAAFLAAVGMISLAEAEGGPAFILPEGVTAVESEAFAGSGITALVVTSGVQTIESRAFADCAGLEDVVLPNHDVNIAEDAFAGCGDIYFHAFAGTKNELWALSHGYRCESLNPDVLQQATGMLVRFGVPYSSLQGADQDFATCRLIVGSLENRLPDISRFQPTEIVQAGKNRFFIQFRDISDTENCYYDLSANLSAYQLKYVEPDRFVGLVDDQLAGQQSVEAGWDSGDPMGFEPYSAFVAEETAGSVIVAVLDSGFPSNAAYNAKLLSDKGRDFSYDGNPWTYDGCNHGRLVAAVIADSVGSAPVRILPLRVTDGRGRADTISLMLALEYAAQQGASYINLSLDFEDPRFESEPLSDAIGDLGAGVVVAAGNFSRQSRTKYFPARLPGVISVGAADPGCTLAGYSCVDGHFAAPGSVTAAGLSKTGTSFAAPQITAALALLHLDPYHTMDDLRATCQAVSGTAWGMPQLSALATRSVVRIEIENAPDTLALEHNSFFLLKCKVYPENATDQTFSVEISDPSVLSVTSNAATGEILVQGLKPGIAVITVRSNSNPEVFATKNMTVIQPVKSITVQGPENGTVYLDQKNVILTASVSPDNASDPSVKWTSSRPSVAAIDADTGKINPVKTGAVTFTATANDGFGAAASLSLTVASRPKAESVTVTAQNDKDSAFVGETLQLSAQALPELASQEMTWESLFPQIASIDQNGLATFLSGGNAVFTATCADGSNKKGSYQITVKIPVESVNIQSAANTLLIGDTLQLSAEALPTDASDRSVTWKSGKTSVATVTKSGKVKGVSAGKAVITATSVLNPSVKDTFTVTVLETVTVTLNRNDPSGEPDASPTSFKTAKNQPLGSLPVPTLEGYTFAGWFTSPDGGEAVNADTVVSADSTFYAHWIDPNLVDSGALSDSITWKLKNGGVLTISGTGAIPHYESGESPFYYDSRVSSCVIEEGITRIDSYTFEGCSLTEISLPDSLTDINYHAFFKSQLRHIEISSSVTFLSTTAFVHSDELESIQVDTRNPNYCSVDGVLFNKSKTELICYPAKKTGETYTVPSGVQTICVYAFLEQANLKQVILPDGVTKIDYGAFEEADCLENIQIPESVTSIGEFAFYNCSSLASIEIPNSVTSIGVNAFAGCDELVLTVEQYSEALQYAIDNQISYVIKEEEDPIEDNFIETVDGFIIERQYDGTYKVISYNGTDTAISILRKASDGGAVTSIGYSAFTYCPGLTSITISDSVTSIDSLAFTNCNSLMNIYVQEGNPSYSSVEGVLFNKDGTQLVTFPCGRSGGYIIPSGTASIGDYAFRSCNGLSDITIPESVTSIGLSAFEDCSSLTNIMIPKSVTSIHYCAFDQSQSLTNILVDEENPAYTSIEGVLFNKDGMRLVAYPKGKTGESYTVPSGTTSIGNYAFSNSVNLTSVTLPDSVTTIDDSAFYKCSNLISITLSENLTSIGGWAFQHCRALKSITFPDSLTSIGVAAFDRCSSLTSIAFPNSMKTINSSFSLCTALTTVTIPKSVTSINKSAFSSCNSLTSILVDDENPSYSSIDGVLFDKTGTTLVCFPGGKTNSYTIPSGTTSIGEEAFNQCDNLTSVTIPNTVTSIDAWVFYYCKNLTGVAIPSSVTNIDRNAFTNYKNFTIYGASGSYAEQWASDNQIPFSTDPMP